MGESHRTTNGTAPFAVDRVVTLRINGSNQRVRLCARREGLPPLLIVQAGPGFPLLHEVRKFQRRLRLEDDFLVCYWDQRGCGRAPSVDARTVTMEQQVDDVRALLQWLHAEAKQAVIVFAISLGATFALLAAELEPERIRAVVTISADSHTGRSDAHVQAFLHEHGVRAGNGRLRAKVAKLGSPPYTKSAVFQRRAGMLADLGGVERGRKFTSIIKETVSGMLGAYGLVGTVRAVRNMSAVQDVLLPQLVSLDVFADPPRLAVPVHYIFGEDDPLVPPTLGRELAGAIAAPALSVTVSPHAAHMVHFDQPDLVRAVLLGARKAGHSSRRAGHGLVAAAE